MSDSITHVPSEYRSTWILDTLRRTDYARLERSGETYVDFMGGALYPESLIKVHTDFLSRSVMGNTHSVSNSSKLSLKCADEARAAVLSFFKAPPEYTVVFTANATGALKLVGESFPFTGGSSYVLGTDSHNSIHGIREYATYKGARVCYIQSTPNGGFDLSSAKVNNIILRNRPRSRELAPSLFALTGQSNISNSKNPLSIIEYAAELGYSTLLDAAALAPTSAFSLKEHPVDAMAISFYKMFGFPTGVGALVVKKSFLAQLKRPWFSGGTVDVVQVPGTLVTRAHEMHEQFEAKLQPNGDMLPNSFIEYSASKQYISLRTGCMCNPGAAAAMLGIQGDMEKLYPGVTLRDFENIVGRELGVVRISFGLASNFQDVWKVVRFAALIANERSRQELWDRWMESKAAQASIGRAI
ncbi:hypothetical protein H0H81_010461 [Sphagnurus paluster]|uniref:Aminotransferase class V domain-containing protein n=1 Tax=Sphagnurus paluster TaxID=117069 RepID=A0A9P7KNS0_9AGAR|nr:hypothetical protein H0H81_010461 [Sphagnurus paluster]